MAQIRTEPGTDHNTGEIRQHNHAVEQSPEGILRIMKMQKAREMNKRILKASSQNDCRNRVAPDPFKRDRLESAA